MANFGNISSENIPIYDEVHPEMIDIIDLYDLQQQKHVLLI